MKTTVLKIGGAKIDDPNFLAALAAYVRKQNASSTKLVIVHGGGPQIEALHTKMGVEYRKVNGLRVTSAESMPLVTQVLCGYANKALVSHLQSQGFDAFGMSGMDGGFMRTSLLDEEVYGRVGDEPEVKLRPLTALLNQRYLPVVAPVCLGPDLKPVNVNADSAAMAIAENLGAARLEFVSDVEGVCDDGVVIPRLDRAAIDELIACKVVGGGMVPKLKAALAAIDNGVGSVRIGSLAGMLEQTATEIVKTDAA